MFHWFSPFPLDPAVRARLERVGLSAAKLSSHEFGLPEPGSTVLLYDAPHNLLTLEPDQLSIDLVLDGYRSLLELSPGAARLVAVGRITSLTDDLLSQWMFSKEPFRSSGSLQDPTPMEALLTKALLEVYPPLLNAYLDLELKADLGGGSPDSVYLGRLATVLRGVGPEGLLSAWRAPITKTQTLVQLRLELEAKLTERDQALTESSGNLENLQGKYDRLYEHLDQVREELENFFNENQRLLAIADAALAKDQELSQKDQELTHKDQELIQKDNDLNLIAQKVEAARRESAQSRQKVQDLQAQNEEDKRQLGLAQEEVKRTLRHLKVVQGELERYFDENQCYESLGVEFQIQVARAEALLLPSKGMLSIQ